METIKLRPHQIEPFGEAVVYGSNPATLMRNGPKVAAIEAELIEQVRSDPATLIEVVLHGGHLCDLGCAAREHLQCDAVRNPESDVGSALIRLEERAAWRLGLKIGETVPANQIYALKD